MVSRKEIIKGLELCNEHRHRDCTECPYNDGTLFCADVLMRDALELIKELKEEINFLKFTQSHDIIGMRDSQGNLF